MDEAVREEPGKGPAEERESLLDFPCDYPLKVMGVASAGFQAEAFAIVGQHVPGFDGSLVETRPSREGRYVSYTFHIVATSRTQLDELYADLGRCPAVKAVL